MGYGIQKDTHVKSQQQWAPPLIFLSNEVIWANVPIRAPCKDFLNRDIICAGGGINETGTCNGDSGGPLVVKDLNGDNVQIGLVSTGTPGIGERSWVKCDSTQETWFAPVEPHLSWIQCIIMGSNGCSNLYDPHPNAWLRWNPDPILETRNAPLHWDGIWSLAGCNVSSCGCCPLSTFLPITLVFGTVEIRMDIQGDDSCPPFPALRFPQSQDSIVFDWNNKTWTLKRDESETILIKDRASGSGQCNLWLQCESGHCVTNAMGVSAWEITTIVLVIVIGLLLLALLAIFFVSRRLLERRRLLEAVHSPPTQVPEQVQDPSAVNDGNNDTSAVARPKPKWIELQEIPRKPALEMHTVTSYSPNTVDL